MRVVARGLLGKLITNYSDGERLTGRILEVEAYLGNSDPASYTFAGKTPRNAVLFGLPPSDVFACRSCLQVAYESQREAPHYLALRDG